MCICLTLAPLTSIENAFRVAFWKTDEEKSRENRPDFVYV
jgi:hypothetical protein